MQRTPYSRWVDSGWAGGRFGPTGPRGSLLQKLQMKVSSTSFQINQDTWITLDVLFRATLFIHSFSLQFIFQNKGFNLLLF